MKYKTLQQLAKLIKGIVLISLVITFGFFIKEVWIKFTDQATNYMQSFNKVDFYEVPTVTICFNPSTKPSMKKQYNLAGLDFINLVNTNSSINSMTKMFEDSYYHHGRDFTFTVTNWKFQAIELNDRIENVIEYSEGMMMKVIVNKFHSYLSGFCYSLSMDVLQSSDKFLGFGLVFKDSLKEKKDVPHKVKVIFTSKINAFGIIRGTWVEGDQFETSLSLEEGGSLLANLREYRYHLLSSPPHCQKISHYECLGYGLEKVLENEKFCTSTPYGSMCVNECPSICLPLVFQDLAELVNFTIPICATGEENGCIAWIIWSQLVELSKNCSTSCTIIKYKGVASGKYRFFSFTERLPEFFFQIQLFP